MADNTMSLFVWPSFCLHFSSSTIYLLSCSLCIAVLSDGCSGAMGVFIFRRYCPQYCVQVAGKKKKEIKVGLIRILTSAHALYKFSAHVL